MHISAVTICCNYSDFLCHTLPSMRPCFNHLLVVTSKEDKKTQNLCKYWNIECLITDIMYENGAKFNKGKAIQLALDYLNPEDWCVQIDSDIYLPPRFNEFLRCKQLNKDFIYGIDRLEIKDYETWINFYQDPFSQHDHSGSVWAGFPVMYRYLNSMEWHPLGFFQLWNMDSKYYGGYPTKFDNAANSDVAFSSLWPSKNRSLIAESFCYHLSSEQGAIGANWSSRTTKPFQLKEN